MTTSPLVAFQGEPGAYSEAAVLEHFGADTQTLPCESFDAVFAAVEGGQVDFGLIAIENSVAGSIHTNYDLLMKNTAWIVGEHYLRVRHCLIASPQANLAGIQRVISHPQALAQCEGYIKSHGLKSEVFYDTAGSVKYLSQLPEPDLTTAGIASRRAAQVYGMQILAEGIEDNRANYTRFQVISRTPNTMPSADAKTTIVFTLKNEPGSLFKALSVFALRDIDLTKIESRPLVGRLWEYLFYLDLAGSVENPSVQKALSHLEEYAASLRVLGSYPRHRFQT